MSWLHKSPPLATAFQLHLKEHFISLQLTFTSNIMMTTWWTIKQSAVLPTCSQALEPTTVLWWHSIPRLRCSVMKVIDTVQVHVLRVPRKQRLPHPKVQVRSVHALNANANLVLDLVENCAKAVDIPHLLIHIIQWSRDVGAVDWIVERDVLPKFAFQVVIVRMKWSAVSVRCTYNKLISTTSVICWCSL